jgi:hypothetical protein
MNKSQTSDNILRRYPLALGCAAVSCAILVALFFRHGTLVDTNARLEQLEADGKSVERNVRNSTGLEDHLGSLNRTVSRLEAMLTRVDDIAGNQEYFYGLEKASGVAVTVLRPLGAPKSTAAGALYQPAGFNVVVEGTYPQLCVFLHALECGQRLYHLNDFSVQRSSNAAANEGRAQKEVLTINLQLLAAK